MNYRYHKPTNPQVSDYIRTVLVLDGNPAHRSSNLPLFTNGMPALLCRQEIDAKPQITLFGQSVPFDNWSVNENAILVAYFFKPFALGTAFKISAHKLKKCPIELGLWNAQKTMALSHQLLHSKSSEETIEILDHFILMQILVNQRDCEIIRHATDKMMQNPNADVLLQIQQEQNLTERTFQRIFKKYIGISPNQYRRICQFYFAFSQLKSGHFDKLTDVAYTNGYFDQSHYIRSFKEFADSTPNEYLKYGLK